MKPGRLILCAGTRGTRVLPLCAILCVLCVESRSEIIQSSNRIDWIPGVTVGVRGGIVTRTNLINAVTQYGADNTGASSAVTAIHNAIAAAASNDVVFLPSGTYDIRAGLVLNKSGVTLRGVMDPPTVVLPETDLHLGLYQPVDTNWYFNLRGQSEKYVKGTISTNGYNEPDGYWYYLLPNGDFYEFTPPYSGLPLAGELMVNLGTNVYAHPELIASRSFNTNKTILVGNLSFGYIAIGSEFFAVTSGGGKGTTNLTLASKTDQWGSELTPGHTLQVSASFSTTNAAFPVISTSGYRRLIKQNITVNTVSGLDITFSPPLVFDFTNGPYVFQRSDWQTEQFKPKRYMGLENVTLTLSDGGLSGNPSTYTLVAFGLALDSWVSGCAITNAGNYCVTLDDLVHCQVSHSTIGFVGVGSSHSGLIAGSASGCLIEDNIFINCGQLGLMFNEGFCGNAVFANYFSANSSDIDCHNSHPVMNLWEQNYLTTYFVMDGFFGSASHQTLFRNFFGATVAFKRWTTYMQVVGNVAGTAANGPNSIWSNEASGHGAPWPLFQLGFPSIGNNTYTYVSPPLSFNWPGTNFNDGQGNPHWNGILITSTQVNTNTLWGADFSAIPAPVASNFPLKFQVGAGGDTNLYYPDAFDGNPILSASAGTTTNLVLHRAVTVSNGWVLYVTGPLAGAYQQLQSADKLTHNFHGNLVYTNSATPTLVWDAGNADHDLPDSLLYDAEPSWWGTNRWPAIDPEGSPYLVNLPAHDRYLGVFPSDSIVVVLTNFTLSGKFNISGRVRL